MSTPFLDQDGNPVHGDQLLGYGGSGVVILHHGIAIKMPLRYRSSSDDDVNENIEVIQREQEVYRRLDHCEGVVPCLGFSATTIRLAYMKHGDLRSFLKQNQSSRLLQLSWFRQMAHALAHIHRHSVIVADIASRNLLLDSDLSIKFCDFTESTIMPLDVDMEDVDDNGYSIQTDIGQLGTIFYEVVTGERCEFDLFKDNPPDVTDAVWPRRETLPCTKHIWLGSIIEKCWTKGAFPNANHLAEALDAIELEESEIEESNRPWKTAMLQSDNINIGYLTTLTLAIGIAAFLVSRGWRYR